MKVCTSLPSIFMTGVHPPSPHPKFPMWQKTDNGWESTRRVTTPLTFDLLNQNEKKNNTTSNENNDGEKKLELIKIIIIATTVAMKMIMGKIQSDNNNNDSTNKQMKIWSFRRQNLRNINTSLYNNNTRLCALESNMCAKVKDIFHFFCEDNALHWNGSRFKGWLSPHMEYGLKIGVYSVPWWV